MITQNVMKKIISNINLKISNVTQGYLDFTSEILNDTEQFSIVLKFNGSSLFYNIITIDEKIDPQIAPLKIESALKTHLETKR